MKNQFHKIVSVVLGMIILFTIPVSADGQITQLNLKPKILSSIQREKIESDLPLEVYKGKYLKDKSSVLNSKSKQILKSFNVNIDDIKDIEIIQNNSLDKTVNRANIGNARVDFDEDGNMVEFINNDDISTVDKDKRDYKDNEPLQQVEYQLKSVEDLSSIIDNIGSINDLQNYKLVDCSNDITGVWQLTWNNDLGNGILNPYDVATASIDGKDGSVIIFTRNTVTPNTGTPIVTKNEAIEFAQPIISKFNSKIIDASLTVTRPNFYWEGGGPYNSVDFVRLAWKVTLDKKKIVMIDAETGEILGGSQTKSSDYGRTLAVVPTFFRNTDCMNLAYNGLNSLGYKQPLPDYAPANYWISQVDINWIFTHPLIYGLYLSCHGLEDANGNYLSAIADGRNWTKYASQVNGNWHFAYLDACWTSSNTAFANAMHTNSAGRCFVGWNVAINETTAFEFDSRFWSKMGQMSICNAVITARNETLVAGFSDCNPGFIGDLNYYGWAW